MRKIKTGVIGVGCRGYSLLETISAVAEAEIVAVCDVYEDRALRAGKKVEDLIGKRPFVTTDYHSLLQDKNVEAVFIASSWDTHVRIAIESLRAGKITALEVGGAYDLEECWELVRTYEETGTPLMLMENCCFGEFELLSTSLVRAGRLGTVVHCHGCYGHDLREEILGGNVNRHYRLQNYLIRNCENYPTHELGPIAKILNINRGNRFVSLVSVASKAAGLEEYSFSENNPDPALRGRKFRQGDIVSTTITCENGETITLRLDTTLPRYYSREFTVRGTKGLCNGEANMIFLEEECKEEIYETSVTLRKYLDNAEKYREYLPQIWKNITPQERRAGHGGMDYLVFKAFFEAMSQNREMPIDVYDCVAWMSVTPLSAQSIVQGGAPQSFPDFTRGRWLTRSPKDVTVF